MRLLTIIMFSAYSAVLLTRLIIRVPHAPFENLEELAEEKLYSVGCIFESYEHSFFMVSKKLPLLYLEKISQNLKKKVY